MTASQKEQNPDWNRLAKEALDLWQEHLSVYSVDPAAKAELVKLATPQLDVARQMFAQWTGMMQHNAHGPSAASNPEAGHGAATAAPPAERGSAASDGGSARDMAQLARRVEWLERQLAELEDRLAASPLAPYVAKPPAMGGSDPADQAARQSRRRKAGSA